MADSSTGPPRRSKRPAAAISPVKPQDATTPSRQRLKKKARFSEPVPAHDTTGLTPAVGKASLKTPKRRVSTPAFTRFRDHDEVQYTPFREELSARTKRQIRRIGLSDEQNQFYAEKRSKSQLQRIVDQKNKEIQTLKDELEASKLRETPLVQPGMPSSQLQISQLEAEVAELTQRSNKETSLFHSGPSEFDEDCGFQIYEDDAANDENHVPGSEDDATVDLELETARQAKEAMFRSSQSFSNKAVQFEDSPVRSSTSTRNNPSAPTQSAHDLSKELNAAINRAEEAEVALQAMTTEIRSLGFPCNGDDAAECLSAIKIHFRDMRFDFERIVPGESTISFNNPRLMPEMLNKLKLVSAQTRDREAELRSMHEQQRSLKGNFDHALIAAGKATARIRELEDAMDKNAEEMLEQRMRCQATEREAKEHEQNNKALIVAIEKYRKEVKHLEELVELIEREQASRLQNVRAATTAEFSQQLSDMGAKVVAETRGRRAAEESAVERLRKINELESALSAARQHSEDVEEQLRSLQIQFAAAGRAQEEVVDGLTSRVSSLTSELAAVNARIDKLSKDRCELERLYRQQVEDSEEFAEQQYKNVFLIAKQSLEDKKTFVRSNKIRIANWELESEQDDLPSDPVGPMTPSSMVRFSEFSEMEEEDRSTREHATDSDDHVEGQVAISRGKRHRRHSSLTLPASSPFLGRGILKKKPRRRYDSGIGMDSLSEAEDEREGVMTPELSSEADVEVENEVLV
ncbi:hypothetical protein A1O7_01206 [Cladophialophora yegresii CBS 114405]|uniref:Uncharacterized protein n=1 Tax=Cladophialophora yegresii CBS 114405 TaxID=1182544 RepID=W9W9V5_9EURO|nr:uncharacterized protein A1O7_01206 [Cladophialophora yegresii CBS 114405]EXJ64867.1 hypothetical protein A1O7_01206 [Cladophialophora yegresii CBS 114405]